MDDDFRQLAEQDRDMKMMARIAEEALARCAGTSMTTEEVECILILSGLHLPKRTDTQRKEPQCPAFTK